jgi:hypothetical protein
MPIQDQIIVYNFMAQNLNALNHVEHELRTQITRSPNVLKSAELERVKHDIEIIAKEVQSMHKDIFETLEDELGVEFKYLLKKKVNGSK